MAYHFKAQLYIIHLGASLDEIGSLPRLSVIIAVDRPWYTVYAYLFRFVTRVGNDVRYRTASVRHYFTRSFIHVVRIAQSSVRNSYDVVDSKHSFILKGPLLYDIIKKSRFLDPHPP